MSRRACARWRRLLLPTLLLLLLATFSPKSPSRPGRDGSPFALAGSAKTLKDTQNRPLSLANTLDGRVVAYGDVTGDRGTDVLTLHDNKVVVYSLQNDVFVVTRQLALEAGHEFLSATVLVETPEAQAPSSPAVMITTKEGDSLCVSLYKKNGVRTEVARGLKYEPTLVSLKGVMGPALLVRGTGNSVTLINVFAPEKKTNSASAVASSGNIGSSSDAYLDLNGNCFPDYFVVSEDYSKFNIYRPKYEQKTEVSVEKLFEHALESNIVSYISFIDIGTRGVLDIVYVTCDGQHCQIKALINEAQARKPEDIGKNDAVCEAQTNSFKFSDTSKLLHSFVADAAETSPGKRFRLVVADFDNDLHSDILVAYGGKQHVLLNQFSKAEVKTPLGEFVGSLFKESTFNLDHAPPSGVVSASLYVTSGDSSAQLVLGSEDKTRIYKKMYGEDAFSMSACILWPGCTTESCPGMSAVMAGANIRILVRNAAGQQSIVHLAQGAQAASQSLQLPCITAGLGRVNNFLQRVVISGGQLPSATFPEVIPNSVLIATHDARSDWRLRMALNANDHAMKVTVASGIVIFLLLIISGFLTWVEKREDERQRMYWI